MPSKKQRNKLNASVASRFPIGATKGDTLGNNNALGNSFRRINSLEFGSIRKAQSLKPFSLK